MRLLSSDKLVAALIKDGFHTRGKSRRGSHQVFRKELPDGARNVVVPLGKKEIPQGTLRSIMRQAGLTEKQLADLLK